MSAIMHQTQGKTSAANQSSVVFESRDLHIRSRSVETRGEIPSNCSNNGGGGVTPHASTIDIDGLI